MAKKQNSLPDFKHTPPPPEVKQKVASSPEDLAEDILKAISGLDVSDQNKVMESLNNKYAAIRYDEYEKARQQEKDASLNLDRFFANTQGIQDFIKARQAAKELSR